MAKIHYGVKPDIFKHAWWSSRGILMMFLKASESPREDPQRERKRAKLREWEKTQNFLAPILRPHLLGGHPSGRHPSGPDFFWVGPHPLGPHHDTHQIQKWIDQKWMGQNWIGQNLSNQDVQNGLAKVGLFRSSFPGQCSLALLLRPHLHGY